MLPIPELPPAFRRYADIGGALAFAAFAEAEAGEEAALSAIASLLPAGAGFDAAKLRCLGNRRIDWQSFFGGWFDPASGELLRLGRFTTDDGRQWENPRFAELDNRRIISGGSEIPQAGRGGQFAYAFADPPYGLQAQPGEVQALFDAIRAFILPAGQQSVILDWSSPRLPEVSRYFEDGMEWWGVFLFTIHVPVLRRLTAIAGSTTD